MELLDIVVAITVASLAAFLTLMTILSYYLETSRGEEQKGTTDLLSIVSGACAMIIALGLLFTITLLDDTLVLYLSTFIFVCLITIKQTDNLMYRWKKDNRIFYEKLGFLTDKEKVIWWVILLYIIGLILNIIIW